jgi:hypothetical protein
MAARFCSRHGLKLGERHAERACDFAGIGLCNAILGFEIETIS